MKINYILIMFILASLMFVEGAKPSIDEQVNAEGIIESYNDSILSPMVGGIVANIKRKEGEFVKQGEVIVELAHQEQSLAVETLRIDYERNRKLYENTQSVSTEELQKKELEYKLAQVELDKRLITAPFEGVVAKLYRRVGEYSDPEEPLIRLVDTRKCRLIAHIEYALAAKLEPGMSIPIIVKENPTPIRFEGTIEHISPVIDASSGLREVKVLFDNSELKIHPGVTGMMI